MANPASLKPFQKGDDPRRNLKGRPVGSISLKNAILEKIEEEVSVGGDRKKIVDLIADKVIKMALDGDFQMIKLIWAYRDGKPPKYKGDDDENTEPRKRKGLRNDDAEYERVERLFAPKDEPKSAYEK